MPLVNAQTIHVFQHSLRLRRLRINLAGLQDLGELLLPQETQRPELGISLVFPALLQVGRFLVRNPTIACTSHRGVLGCQFDIILKDGVVSRQCFLGFTFVAEFLAVHDVLKLSSRLLTLCHSGLLGALVHKLVISRGLFVVLA